MNRLASTEVGKKPADERNDWSTVSCVEGGTNRSKVACFLDHNNNRLASAEAGKKPAKGCNDWSTNFSLDDDDDDDSAGGSGGKGKQGIDPTLVADLNRWVCVCVCVCVRACERCHGLAGARLKVEKVCPDIGADFFNFKARTCKPIAVFSLWANLAHACDAVIGHKT